MADYRLTPYPIGVGDAEMHTVWALPEGTKAGWVSRSHRTEVWIATSAGWAGEHLGYDHPNRESAIAAVLADWDVNGEGRYVRADTGDDAIWLRTDPDAEPHDGAALVRLTHLQAARGARILAGHYTGSAAEARRAADEWARRADALALAEQEVTRG